MRETAIFGAGCFWGVEETFANVRGVLSTSVGYTGGWDPAPTYRSVCGGGTGHTEAVRVEFDPGKVSYEDLVNTFWECHDPTDVNGQGPDRGHQYRSVIFVNGEAQRSQAEASREAAGRSGRFRRPISTAIEPASSFHLAEDYHQKYLAKRGMAACGVG